MAKRPTAKPAEPDVLDPVPETNDIIKEETGLIRAFFAGSLAFFTRATELEREASSILSRANQLKAKHTGDKATPITRDIDEKIQVELRGAKMKRKAIDDHWEITSLASRFHKRLVAGRERAGLMADEAAEITQALHNSYARERERVAREEENRKREQEETRLREEQQAEAARLEAEALRLEAASPMLSEREERFVELVMHGLNTPATAARTVGYAKPEEQGARLMASEKIQRALESKRQASVVRQQVQATLAKPVHAVVERVRPDVTKLAGSRDTKRWKAVVFDEAAFMAAVLDPKARLTHGIPTDVVTFLQPKLNELARALHEKMNTWPGVRAEEDRSLS